MSNDQGSPRPVPRPDAATAPYWEAARQGKLVVQRCRQCRTFIHYPRNICPACLAEDMEYVGSTGRGTVYSLTVTHRPPPAFAGDELYVIALVDLEEGVRMVTRIVGPGAEAARIGARVAVAFEEVAEGVTLPVFRVLDHTAKTDDPWSALFSARELVSSDVMETREQPPWQERCSPE